MATFAYNRPDEADGNFGCAPKRTNAAADTLFMQECAPKDRTVGVVYIENPKRRQYDDVGLNARSFEHPKTKQESLSWRRFAMGITQSQQAIMNNNLFRTHFTQHIQHTHIHSIFPQPKAK